MKRKPQIIRFAVVTLMASLGLVSLLYAQVKTTSAPTKKVVLKITYPDGEWLQAGATEGSVIRIERDGKVFGFTPTVRDAGNGIVEIKVSRITTSQGTDVAEEVGKLVVNSKSPSTTTTDPAFTIQLLRIEKAPEGVGKGTVARTGTCTSGNRAATMQQASYMAHRPMPNDPGGGGGNCCVTCNGVTACANCSVSMSCGSCCLDPCCH
jgi:hypothetical protein